MSDVTSENPLPATSNGSDHHDVTNGEASSISEKSENASVKQLDDSTDVQSDSAVKAASTITDEQQHATDISSEKLPDTAAHESPNHDSPQAEAGAASQANTPTMPSLGGSPAHVLADPSVPGKDSTAPVPTEPPHLPVSAQVGAVSLRGPASTPVLFQVLSPEKLRAEYDALNVRIAKFAAPDTATEREILSTALNMVHRYVHSLALRLLGAASFLLSCPCMYVLYHVLYILLVNCVAGRWHIR